MSGTSALKTETHALLKNECCAHALITRPAPLQTSHVSPTLLRSCVAAIERIDSGIAKSTT